MDRQCRDGNDGLAAGGPEGGTPSQRFGVFHALEARFDGQARLLTLLEGNSLFYRAWRLDAWDRFASRGLWWMHSMVLTWLVFTLMLFVFEPLFLERPLASRAARAPESAYRLVEWLPRFLLGLSLLTGGSRGWKPSDLPVCV